MPRPHDLPEDTAYLDVAHATKLLLAYKRGALGSAILRYRLIVECDWPDHLVGKAIADVASTPLDVMSMIAAEARGLPLKGGSTMLGNKLMAISREARRRE